jgi:hypothetical protein
MRVSPALRREPNDVQRIWPLQLHDAEATIEVLPPHLPIVLVLHLHAGVQVLWERLRLFSSMSRYKLWVEGPNDVPAGEVFAEKLSEDAGVVVCQAVGGWAQVLNDHWSPRGMGDGCSDFVVLLDGDRARDWSRAGFPIRPERTLRSAIAKFKRHKVRFVILERYAIENYFPQVAFESVLGVPLAGHFPLRPDKSVESQVPGYSKFMNGKLSAATALADLKGTDLGALLDEIHDWIVD